VLYNCRAFSLTFLAVEVLNMFNDGLTVRGGRRRAVGGDNSPNPEGECFRGQGVLVVRSGGGGGGYLGDC
jgi:hypothetical protein